MTRVKKVFEGQKSFPDECRGVKLFFRGPEIVSPRSVGGSSCFQGFRKLFPGECRGVKLFAEIIKSFPESVGGLAVFDTVVGMCPSSSE